MTFPPFLNRTAVSALAAVFLLVACDQPFTPKAPFEERLVVYCVLSNQVNTHYARVYTTYDPSGFDPYERNTDPPIVGAKVRLFAGTMSVLFRDTLIERVDKSRYPSDLRAYVTPPLEVQRGAEYLLSVETPDGRLVHGVAKVPGKGYISIRNPSVLADPVRFKYSIDVVSTLSAEARGYVLKMYIEFEILENGVPTLARKEVPQSIYPSEGTGLPGLVYPELTRIRSEQTGTNVTAVSTVFGNDAYRFAIDRINLEHYAAKSVKLKQAILVLTQTDPHLYNYYNIVNGFQDQHTIRTDQPDYTNINGGVGVFGSFAQDSLFVSLPEKI